MVGSGILAVRSFAFGPFVLVPGQKLLMEGGTPVRIGSRALEILIALVERSGELVSKDELVSRAWPNTFVGETNLKVNVAVLRRTLGETSGSTRYIATVNGRGYQFVSPVRALDPGGVSRDTSSPHGCAHNLPVLAVRVVGRSDAVAAVRQQLTDARLVTIVGAGGIGKTTVALAVAELAIATFEHGVWFIDLAFLEDPALIPGAIAAAIGLTVHSADISAALSAFLRDRELMIVLDNCEQIIDAAASCSERILAGAAKVRILATSREPLRACGEQIYRLSPLGTPPQSAALSAADAMAFPAVELFVERAAASVGDFVLSDADAPFVAEICRKLDGIALAIEFAATRVDAFGVRQLLDLLDDQFRLLQGRRTAPGRHQTLAATLDWSHNLLCEDERILLRRLSVFSGAFSLESACAVAADNDVVHARLAADLANLVAKSLVAADIGTATHYRLLETTRRYALRKLAESRELDALRQRHAEHLRDLSEQAETEWKIRPTSEWLAYYGRKVDDIRTALGWAFADSRNAPIGLALTVAAIPFWEHLSLVEECRACVERALESAFDGLRCSRDDMKLHLALGTTLLHTRGPIPEVRSAWTRALQLAERLDDTEYQLRSLWGLCDYHTWTGDHNSALAVAEQIRALAIRNGDAAAVTNVDRQTGTALRYLGQNAQARHHLERMINRYVPPVVRSDIARFQLDPRSAARGTLANVLWIQGYADQAVQMAQRQLEDARAADHALALCNALVHATCPVALFVGDFATAESLLTLIEAHVAAHAMTIWSEMGRCLRGEWLLKRGDASGLAVLHVALDELFETGFRMRYPSHLGAFAAGLCVHGDVDAAHAVIDRAIALSKGSGEVWSLPELLRIKGDVLGAEGAAAAGRAQDQYLQALELARRQGALSWELRAAMSLAELLHQAGRSERADLLLRSTYNRFSEGLGTRDLQRAELLLVDLGKGLQLASG